MILSLRVLPAGALASLTLCVLAPAQDFYRRPHGEVDRAATAAPPPSRNVSPDGRFVLELYREALPELAQLARPMLPLAGIRIDPQRHARQQTRGRTHRIRVVTALDGTARDVFLPKSADVGSLTWAADGRRFAFVNSTSQGLELWLGDAESAKARRLGDRYLSNVLGAPLTWMPDQRRLLVRLWPMTAVAPSAPEVPLGPNIQRSDGKVAPVRTFQDLLRSPQDAALFEHHAQSQLALVDSKSGECRPIGTPALTTQASPSPDGRFLLVTRIVRPFSYLVTSWSFPREVRVIDLDGNEVYSIVDQPLADKVPIGGVVTGPRSVQWLPTLPNRLCWVEALDGGDPKAEVEHRDVVMLQNVPANDAPTQWFLTPYRFSRILFDGEGSLALASTRDRARRWTRTWRVDPSKPDQAPVLWHERAQRDAYGDKGRPLTKMLPSGRSVLAVHEGALFLRGSGATPKGDRPFLRRHELATGKETELFRCADGRYETVLKMLDDAGNRLLVSRESRLAPPNLFVIDSAGERQLTSYVDAQQELVQGIGRKLLNYERADGVPLSAQLFTPPGYREGTRLPTLVWAYPREFVSKKTAGQVRGSPYRYERLAGTSPLMLLLAGFAVLDDAAMPIVGPKESANDSFVQQLVAGAEAAIAAGAAEGVVDPKRCAIAGHSYGAFMTANLLAHSDLFRAGIARSGAYNRTLTPFGFQNERRTYWQAPEIYHAMSPFMHAHKINEPILLIHGERDNNSGTFPIQSQRLFHAIKGHGGLARLVMLPLESHGYRARESVLHVLAESIEWLRNHVDVR